jgi:hypothetical protein
VRRVSQQLTSIAFCFTTQEKGRLKLSAFQTTRLYFQIGGDLGSIYQSSHAAMVPDLVKFTSKRGAVTHAVYHKFVDFQCRIWSNGPPSLYLFGLYGRKRSADTDQAANLLPRRCEPNLHSTPEDHMSMAGGHFEEIAPIPRSILKSSCFVNGSYHLN